MRIVIVEDSTDIRESLEEFFTTLGHSVHVAGDGVAGLATLINAKPDYAFIDIGLPGIDGYELARQARDQLGPLPTFVAMTGYGQPDDRSRAIGSGFNMHLTKPISLDTLEDLLKQPPGP